MDRKIYLLIAILVVAVAAWHVGDANASSSVMRPDLPGPFSVGHTSHTFYDASRDRELLTEVWYPVDPGDESGDTSVYNLGKAAPKGGKIKFKKVEITSGDYTATQSYEGSPISINGPFPLVVYSSGTTGFPFAAFHISEALASHGFIVASVNHTGWTIIEFVLGTRDPVWQTRLDRPDDIVVVIDEMLSRYDMIDPDRIGMIGCSFGAYTAFALAGGIERLGIEADGRLKAIIGYGSAQIPQFSEADFAAIDIPSLLLGGKRDILAPIDPNHLRPFAEMSGSPRYRVDMVDAAHDAWINGCEWGEAALAAGVTELSNIFLRTAVECPPLNQISRAEALRLGRLYTVSFMQTYVADVSGYQSFLTPGYADSSEPNAEVFICGGDCE